MDGLLYFLLSVVYFQNAGGTPISIRKDATAIRPERTGSVTAVVIVIVVDLPRI
jgi:hypothetical protein